MVQKNWKMAIDKLDKMRKDEEDLKKKVALEAERKKQAEEDAILTVASELEKFLEREDGVYAMEILKRRRQVLVLSVNRAEEREWLYYYLGGNGLELYSRWKNNKDDCAPNLARGLINSFKSDPEFLSRLSPDRLVRRIKADGGNIHEIVDYIYGCINELVRGILGE